MWAMPDVDQRELAKFFYRPVTSGGNREAQAGSKKNA